jgi:hypothetical protein
VLTAIGVFVGFSHRVGRGAGNAGREKRAAVEPRSPNAIEVSDGK